MRPEFTEMDDVGQMSGNPGSDLSVSKELSDIEINDIIDEIQSSRSLSKDLSNPELFTENEAGEYSYLESFIGKSASGVLEISDNPTRNPSAQRSAGGDDRLQDDDGGHLIGARFGGSGESENLEAQNREINRSDFKSIENGWATQLENGDKVFVNVDSFRGSESERPSGFLGYAITEHPDGSRESETFCLPNESEEKQELWGTSEREEELEANFEAAINDMEYSDGISENNDSQEGTDQEGDGTC